MDDQTFAQGREATAVEDSVASPDGAESLLNELSGVFDDLGPPNPPKPPADAAAIAVADALPATPADTQAATPEEIPVTSPPRIEPPAIIWKPSRRARFRFRR